jgi:hypothetical protein
MRARSKRNNGGRILVILLVGTMSILGVMSVLVIGGSALAGCGAIPRPAHKAPAPENKPHVAAITQ